LFLSTLLFALSGCGSSQDPVNSDRPVSTTHFPQQKKISTQKQKSIMQPKK